MGRQVIRSGDILVVGADTPVGTEAVRLVGKQRYEGGVEQKFKKVAFADSPYDVTDDDSVLLVESSTGAVTIVLQAVAACDSRLLTIFDWDGQANVNNITVAAQPGETINSLASIKIVTSGGGCQPYCDALQYKTLAASV